ncbi:hypothetical protein PAMP_016180 [Pampus punctatissimus]
MVKSQRPAAAPPPPPLPAGMSGPFRNDFSVRKTWHSFDANSEKFTLIVTPIRKRCSLELCLCLLMSSQQGLDMLQEALCDVLSPIVKDCGRL